MLAVASTHRRPTAEFSDPPRSFHYRRVAVSSLIPPSAGALVVNLTLRRDSELTHLTPVHSLTHTAE
jgi:hypothetical protein